MENIGTWNSDFVVWLVFLMLAPLFISFLVKIYVLLSEINQSQQDSPGTPTLQDVKDAALRKAAEGDRHARDWCSKHVFNNFGQPQKQSAVKITKQKAENKPVVTFLTDRKIMEDTVKALIAVGYKKYEAQSLVAHTSTKCKYCDVSGMFLDIINANR